MLREGIASSSTSHSLPREARQCANLPQSLLHLDTMSDWPAAAMLHRHIFCQCNIRLCLQHCRAATSEPLSCDLIPWRVLHAPSVKCNPQQTSRQYLRYVSMTHVVLWDGRTVISDEPIPPNDAQDARTPTCWRIVSLSGRDRIPGPRITAGCLAP